MRHKLKVSERSFRLAVLLGIALGPSSFGATIVAITGNQSAFEAGDATDIPAQGWRQTGSYTNVVIRATLQRGTIGAPNGDGTAFLSKKSGSHAVELVSTQFLFPKTQSEVVLFSNLSLGPGTYYLSLYGEGFWMAEFQPVISSAADVLDVTDTLISTDGGHTFFDSNNGAFQDYRVTGIAKSLQDAPEPAAAWLVLGGLACLSIVRRTRLNG